MKLELEEDQIRRVFDGTNIGEYLVYAKYNIINENDALVGNIVFHQEEINIHLTKSENWDNSVSKETIEQFNERKLLPLLKNLY